MKLFSLDDTPYGHVSHDPALKKKVLVPDGNLPGIMSISHVVLPKGSKASAHEHDLVHEVFFVISGEVVFNVSGREVLLKQGMCLDVEPYEQHFIVDTPEECTMLYLHVKKA